MNTGKAKLLIVDDEEEIRKSLARHYEFEGYSVSTAKNGIEALKLMEESRFEVVITDIKMPEMDGLELLKAIKEHYPMTHTIVMTGYVTMENLLAAIRYGADTCIFKPFKNMEELDSAIEHAIEHLQTWQRKLKELKGIKH